MREEEEYKILMSSSLITTPTVSPHLCNLLTPHGRWHSPRGTSMFCSVSPHWLRIKATFLFPPNSVSVLLLLLFGFGGQRIQDIGGKNSSPRTIMSSEKSLISKERLFLCRRPSGPNTRGVSRVWVWDELGSPPSRTGAKGATSGAGNGRAVLPTRETGSRAFAICLREWNPAWPQLLTFDTP